MADPPLPGTPLLSGHPALQIEELTQSMGWLRSLALALVDDPHDADDLVQSALSVAVASKTEIRDLRGFLGGIVRKLAWNQRRSERHQTDRAYLRAREQSSEAPPAEHHLEAMDTMRVALEEMSKLPEAQAKTLSLRFVEGLDVNGIAQRVGSTPSAVRSNLSRGLQTLRERLDDRYGDRSSWGLAVIPLALPPAFPGGAAQAPDPTGAGSALKTASAASKPAAAVSVLGAGLSLKAAAVAVPVLLAASYFQLRPEGASAGASKDALQTGSHAAWAVSAQRSSGEAMTAPQEAPGAGSGPEPTALDPIDSRGRERSELSTVQVPSRGPEIAGAEADGETVSAELSFVHIDDRSPLFDFEVLVTPEGSVSAPRDSASRPQDEASAPQVAPERVEVTDREGRLRLDDLSAGTTHLSLDSRLRDQDGMGPFFSPQTVPVDRSTPVVVMLGPTIPLAFSGLPLEPGTPMTVELEGPGIEPLESVIADVTWGDSPFVRLRSRVAEPGSVGPWRLLVQAKDGWALGEGTTTQLSGSRTDAVKILVEGAGVARFRAVDEVAEGMREAPLPFVTLKLLGSDDLRVVQLQRSNGALIGSSGPLLAGDYAWSAPGLVDESGNIMEGQLEIVVGEPSVVDLPTLGGPNLARTITIDATAVPGADLSGWTLGLMDPYEKKTGSQLALVPAKDLGRGMWRVPIGPVPTVGWVASLAPSAERAGYRVSPALLVMTAGGALETLAVTERVDFVSVQLHLVDSTTGAPILAEDGAEAVQMVRPSTRTLLGGTGGSLTATDVPADRETTFLCRAEGYQMREVFFAPGNSSSDLTVRMRPGWSNVVRVVSLEAPYAASGISVWVNGREAGVTDKNGCLWLEGAGPPKRVELRLGGTDFTCAAPVFENTPDADDDPLAGYTFLVGKR